jgi:hypothetical protein
MIMKVTFVFLSALLLATVAVAAPARQAGDHSTQPFASNAQAVAAFEAQQKRWDTAARPLRCDTDEAERHP